MAAKTLLDRIIDPLYEVAYAAMYGRHPNCRCTLTPVPAMDTWKTGNPPAQGRYLVTIKTPDQPVPDVRTAVWTPDREPLGTGRWRDMYHGGELTNVAAWCHTPPPYAPPRPRSPYTLPLQANSLMIIDATRRGIANCFGCDNTAESAMVAAQMLAAAPNLLYKLLDCLCQEELTQAHKQVPGLREWWEAHNT